MEHETNLTNRQLLFNVFLFKAIKCKLSTKIVFIYN